MARRIDVEKVVEEAMERRDFERKFEERREKWLDERAAIYNAPNHFAAAEAALSSEHRNADGNLAYAEVGLGHAILALIESRENHGK